ncbi:unnamed protein product, partial [Symbiodinium microadriaticum]
MIHAFWQDFWRSRALTAPTPEELAQALVENGIRYQGGIDWEPPDLEHLVHTFRRTPRAWPALAGPGVELRSQLRTILRPKIIISEWAKMLGCPLADLTGGNWERAERVDDPKAGPVVIGHLRVAATLATKIVSKSGTRGWRQVQVVTIRKSWTRGNPPEWIFPGVRPEGCPSDQITWFYADENTQLSVGPLPPRKRAPAEATSLPAPLKRWVDRDAETSSTGAKTGEGPVSGLGAGPSAQGTVRTADDDDRQDEGAQRAQQKPKRETVLGEGPMDWDGSDDSVVFYPSEMGAALAQIDEDVDLMSDEELAARADARLLKELPLGWAFQEVGSDGDCAFRALAWSLSKAQGVSIDGPEALQREEAAAGRHFYADGIMLQDKSAGIGKKGAPVVFALRGLGLISVEESSVLRFTLATAAKRHYRLKHARRDTSLEAIQKEVTMKEHEWMAYARHAAKQGFTGYYEPGQPTRDRWHNLAARGGVAVFVSKRLRQLRVASFSGQHSQMIVVAAQGRQFASLYVPPGHGGVPETEAGAFLTALLQQHTVEPDEEWSCYQGREDNFDVIQGLTAKLQLAEPSLRTVTALIRNAAGQVSSSALAGAGFVRDYWIGFWNDQELLDPMVGLGLSSVTFLLYTRPIPILNAHWRLWASSWLQTDGFRQWIDKHIPDNVRARKGFSIIGTATGILEDFSEEGYALSLDWSKCFDCLAPAVTALPRGLALVCADIWSHQVESRVPADLPAKTTLYVDDRTMVPGLVFLAFSSALGPLGSLGRELFWEAFAFWVRWKRRRSEDSLAAALTSFLESWAKKPVRPRVLLSMLQKCKQSEASDEATLQQAKSALTKHKQSSRTVEVVFLRLRSPVRHLLPTDLVLVLLLSPFKAPAKAMIRVVAPSHYRACCKESRRWDSPQAIVSELAQWKVEGPSTQASSLTGGSWQWTKHKGSDQLIGHLRVSESLAQALAPHSGRRGIFISLIKDQTPTRIGWIPKLEDEEPDDYLSRCSSLASGRGASLKYRCGGGNDLGVVRKDGEAEDLRAVVVNVRAPKDWEAEGLLAFLLEQKWLEPQVMTKRGSCWLVKGLPNSAEAESASGATIRTQCLSHIRKHADRYATFLQPDVDGSEMDSEDLEMYLGSMAHPRAWIDGIMIQAAAEKYGQVVVIWHRPKPQMDESGLVTQATWQRTTLAPAWAKDGTPRKKAGNSAACALVTLFLDTLTLFALVTAAKRHYRRRHAGRDTSLKEGKQRLAKALKRKAGKLKDLAKGTGAELVRLSRALSVTGLATLGGRLPAWECLGLVRKLRELFGPALAKPAAPTLSSSCKPGAPARLKLMPRCTMYKSASMRTAEKHGHKVEWFTPHWASWKAKCSARLAKEKTRFLTCTKCLRVAGGDWGRACQGATAANKAKLRAHWKDTSPQNRNILLRIWNLTKEQVNARLGLGKRGLSLALRNHKRKKLVFDGIERHPGPSSCQAVRVLSLNVGGARKLKCYEFASLYVPPGHGGVPDTEAAHWRLQMKQVEPDEEWACYQGLAAKLRIDEPSIRTVEALIRWLQSKAASAPHSLKNAAGLVSSSALAGAGFVRDYWINFWSEQVARTMRGAAGPDGWSGPELSHLPLEALSTFRHLAMRWESSGRVPAALREARMVSLANEGKAVDGVLDLQHTRPITILKAHWRLWASAWLQTDGFRKWIDKHIPDNIREGYALSLDWSKCFDCLAPAVTARLMTEWNLPSGLASVCADVWSHQVCWVSWSGCTHGQPLRTATSVPQGDPFGPLAAMLWATCGLTEVESRAPAHLPAKTTIFVDDRSITASDPLALVARKSNWFAWSSAVGLRENESKVAVVATTAARRRRAEDSGLAEWIKDSMRVLGAYTASRARQLTEDEVRRGDRVCQTANRFIRVLMRMKWQSPRPWLFRPCGPGFVLSTPTRLAGGCIALLKLDRSLEACGVRMSEQACELDLAARRAPRTGFLGVFVLLRATASKFDVGNPCHGYAIPGSAIRPPGAQTTSLKEHRSRPTEDEVLTEVVQAIGQHMQIDLAGSQQGWWEGQETDKSTSPADTRWQDTDAWNGWWSPAEWREWKAQRQYSRSEWVDYTNQENRDYMQWPSLQEGAPTANKPDKGTRFVERLNPSEWTGNAVITTPNQIQKALENGEEIPGNVVISRDAETYALIRNIFDAFDVDKPMTVAQIDKQDATGPSMAVWFYGRSAASAKPQRVKLKIFQVSEFEGPEPKPPVAMNLPDKPKIPMVTLRLLAPGHYRQYFLPPSVKDTPTTLITAWAQLLAVPVSTLSGGKWESVTVGQHSTMIGHVRVPQALAQRAQSFSGHRALFCAVLSKPNQTEKVAWIKNDDQKSVEDYLRAAQAAAKEQNKPLVTRQGGKHDLGILGGSVDEVNKVGHFVLHDAP